MGAGGWQDGRDAGNTPPGAGLLENEAGPVMGGEGERERLVTVGKWKMGVSVGVSQV